ncbi:MAG: NAD(P)-dependent alcohol dehydrogenase [Actinomycetes bacterium]
MKAAVNTRYGPPTVVHIADVADPALQDNDVLIRVHVATVNRTDCGFRSGSPFIVRFFSGLTKPKLNILGTEFAGQVEAIGAGVTAFAVGDRVFGYSEDRFGAHAQYLTMPQDGPVATIPPNISYEQAAASTEASHYALASIKKAKVVSGHDVLVYGATGAIGSAAVQLLKTVGANVTAVCGPEHLDLVKSLGADRVIDRSAQDFTKDRAKYDLVFDAVGKSSFGRCKALLKPGGIYASTDLGPGAQNPVLAIVTPVFGITGMFGGKQAMLPIPPKYDQEMVLHFRSLIESGQFKPVIDRRYTLEQIVEAYTYVETGQKVGNVLLTIDGAPA